jgi:predicted PhzF superfamily epimerase YddE/YHI9
LVRGVSAEQLRAFLTSVLIKPTKQHNLLRLFRPAEEPPKAGSPTLVSQEPKT